MPLEYVARHGVERLMTRCSHRRSFRLLVLFDLGMQLGVLPILTLHRVHNQKCISISIRG